ncbi:unnamed protein product [Pleuronectes platessa]|uniref:Uncharacterized protein n=1 Tax=Pleuronectes platessa TaxID=8262 RepID=A0A9N7VFJ3_PLEPL|nr:unnamed protein product [Pleuronectes platessa]
MKQQGLQQIAAFAGSKAPAPTGCALGNMPDGGHCRKTSTSPHWDSEHSRPEASRDSGKLSVYSRWWFGKHRWCEESVWLTASMEGRELEVRAVDSANPALDMDPLTHRDSHPITAR